MGAAAAASALRVGRLQPVRDGRCRCRRMRTGARRRIATLDRPALCARSRRGASGRSGRSRAGPRGRRPSSARPRDAADNRRRQRQVDSRTASFPARRRALRTARVVVRGGRAGVSMITIRVPRTGGACGARAGSGPSTTWTLGPGKRLEQVAQLVAAVSRAQGEDRDRQVRRPRAYAAARARDRQGLAGAARADGSRSAGRVRPTWPASGCGGASSWRTICLSSLGKPKGSRVGDRPRRRSALASPAATGPSPSASRPRLSAAAGRERRALRGTRSSPADAVAGAVFLGPPPARAPLPARCRRRPALSRERLERSLHAWRSSSRSSSVGPRAARAIGRVQVVRKRPPPAPSSP